MDSGSGGAFATRIDDVLGLRGPGVREETQTFLGAHFGELTLQGSPFAHVGMRMLQANDYSVQLTQNDFSSKLAALETSPALWAARRQLLSPEDVLGGQCTPGELRWPASASRPGIRARLSRLASKVN